MKKIETRKNVEQMKTGNTGNLDKRLRHYKENKLNK